MSLSRPFALATVAFVAAPFLAFAAPQPIDLATTLRLAGADNLSVRIAREKLAEARADAAHARAAELRRQLDATDVADVPASDIAATPAPPMPPAPPPLPALPSPPAPPPGGLLRTVTVAVTLA